MMEFLYPREMLGEISWRAASGMGLSLLAAGIPSPSATREEETLDFGTRGIPGFWDEMDPWNFCSPSAGCRNSLSRHHSTLGQEGSPEFVPAAHKSAGESGDNAPGVQLARSHTRDEKGSGGIQM